MTDDREKLIEEMAREVAALNGHSDDWDRFLDEARDYLAAAERALAEKYSAVAEQMIIDLKHEEYQDKTWYLGAKYACKHIASAIRASVGKSETKDTNDGK